MDVFCILSFSPVLFILSKTTYSFVIHLVQTNYKRICHCSPFPFSFFFFLFFRLFSYGVFSWFSCHQSFLFSLSLSPSIFRSLCLSLTQHSSPFQMHTLSPLPPLLLLLLLSTVAAMSIINIRRCQLCVQCHSFPLLFAYLFLSRWIIVCHCLVLIGKTQTQMAMEGRERETQ